MASPSVLWWKFQLPGMGSHLLRVKGAGTQEQEVQLDGVPLEAPPGTTTFTGPGASLLELQAADGAWSLLVDGAPVDSYQPEMAPVEAPPVAWFKFAVNSMGIHHVRVKGIGSPSQEILLDGTPLDAPVGTMAFTGPGGSLLELQRRDGIWVLAVDGAVVHQSSPHSSSGPPLVWDFEVPGTGSHRVSVSGAGEPGQELRVDGALVPAPPGQMAFTGPGGALLELKHQGGSWALFVDGVELREGAAGASSESEASWIFVEQRTGLQHGLQAFCLGSRNQTVFLDGEPIPGPEGQTAFTGPGGLLLELKNRSGAWELLVDGVPVAEHNTRAGAGSLAIPSSPVNASTGFASPGGAAARMPVSSDLLPQGVSHDPATGKYTSNVRIKGRFKCLGEFSTPEEAHARYLEAKKELGDA